MMFEDYRNDWKGYPDISHINLGDKYLFLRTTARYFTMYDGELFLDDYHYLANSTKCFNNSLELLVEVKNKSYKLLLVDFCLNEYLIRPKFKDICKFINEKISLYIDLNTRKTNLVLEKIACNMISKLPVLTHNEKASLMSNLHFNILDAEREWRDYYAKNVLQLPF